MHAKAHPQNLWDPRLIKLEAVAFPRAELDGARQALARPDTSATCNRLH